MKYALSFEQRQEGKSLVERLRGCRSAGSLRTFYMLNLMDEAADEIERLRAAVKREGE